MPSSADPIDPLHRALLARIESCYRQAESHFDRTFPRPAVSLRMRGQSAGAAHLQDNRLRFNPVLLAENPDAFLTEVVPHEVAHLLVWHCHGRVAPHGAQWQSMMRDVFGLVPRTRHQFDVASVAPKTYAYRCQCQEHQLTVRRHNKVSRGQARYLCRGCGAALKPV
ncbi:SprT family zinc-dependent metalloprotease [Ferrimonas balearica]|uniref:SprT family zinc-dependent metalloprotease n=1 Tax=Ferrimonas balearica TaxID=44012 RepID=UPI001C9A0FFA|nr:SprT family zinc-dependent metalloprotease [Ferrimonas balearica]MBY5922985.1 SprT family zinc-dependent metalloprotease [Ferrimonas balearica]MBY5997638.1 SprT family zinc-dependent metalloprotease [Ferrimonas balearica]